MWEALEACRIKAIAGAEHMDRFCESIDGFLEEERRIAVLQGETNSQRTKYLFRVERMAPVPTREWAVMVGDAVHCLRSALDQLAYTFATDPSRLTAFPICLTEKEWVTQAPAQYWSIMGGLVKLFDRVQPYHREQPDTHPLAILRAVSNLDKHRTIPTIALVADESEATVVTTDGIESWNAITFKRGAAFKKGAVVAESKIVPESAVVQPKMDVEFKAAFDIVFGDIPAAPSIRGRSVTEVINEVGEYVVKIIAFVGDVWNKAVEEADAADPEPEWEW